MLELRELSLHFGGIRAVDRLNLDIALDGITALIGPNGAGKTSLFNLICGQERASSGSILLDGQTITRSSPEARCRLGLVRTFQHGRVFPNLSVMENLLAVPGAHPDTAIALLDQFGERLLPRKDEPAYRLSYANRRRLEIARALICKPRLLLLDEPCAGMNSAETAEMLDFLRRLHDHGQAILIIEHKLSLVFSLASTVLVMDEGRLIAQGNGEAVRHDPAVIEAYLGKRRQA